MPQTLHLFVAKNLGYGIAEGKCLPCSGVSGRTASVYSCSSVGHRRIQYHVKVRGLKCSSSRGASVVCEARRNPDFSRQNKHGLSRSRNRNNDGRDNFEEDMLSLKNGPPVSVSSSGKFQSTAAPGPREKEIVELFRKVQARLRERAATKEEKKVEASRGQGKENSTVDSLLKLLKKHSVEQVKRSSGGGRGKNFSSDQLQESNRYDGGRSTKISDFDSAPKDETHESQEVNISSVVRPRSNFQRRSPVPRVKYQPFSNNEDDMNDVPVDSGDREDNEDRIDLKLDDEPEPDSESDIDSKDDELFFPNIGMAELSEDDDSHDSEQTYNNESVEEQPVVQHEDLSTLKLSELRALAKSRGLKGFSKMKKVELIELLTES